MLLELSEYLIVNLCPAVEHCNYETLDRKRWVDSSLNETDGLQKLRVIYPNLMQLTYDNLRTQQNQEIIVDEE